MSRPIPHPPIALLRPPSAAPAASVEGRAPATGVLLRAGVLPPLLLGGGALIVAQVAALALWLVPGTAPPGAGWLLPLPPLLLGVGTVALGLAGWCLYQGLLGPLRILEANVDRICQGEPGVRLGADQAGVLNGLADAIQSLSDELLDLYEDMDNRVAHQTRRLAQKTASLKILYDVAISINQAQNLEGLLTREQIASAGIDPSARAETLAPAQFAALARLT